MILVLFNYHLNNDYDRDCIGYCLMIEIEIIWRIFEDSFQFDVFVPTGYECPAYSTGYKSWWIGGLDLWSSFLHKLDFANNVDRDYFVTDSELNFSYIEIIFWKKFLIINKE